MAFPSLERPAHPCLARQCGHSTESHLATPELAAPGELVIWCARCRRHEVRGMRWMRLAHRSPARVLSGLGVFSF